MRRILRASPAALKRAMAMFAPLDKPAVPPIAERQPATTGTEPAQPVECKESASQE